MLYTTLLAAAVLTTAVNTLPFPAAAVRRVGPQAQAQLPPQSAAPLTAAQLAPFVGDWTLTMQGPNGPGTFALSIAMEKDKPQGEITNETMPKQPITDFSMTDKSLSLSYSFTWEGTPVSAVIWLTPSAEGPMKAQIDFAGGAYVMNGTAARKEKKASAG